MKLIFSLTLSLGCLFASNILTYKLYDREENGRMDMLLTFDTPYNGRITQKKVDETTTLILYDALYAEKVEKNVNSAFITLFSIIPEKDRTSLSFTLPKGVSYKVSKTVDDYGLRLRFEQGEVLDAPKTQSALDKIKTINSQETNANRSLVAKEPLISKRYAAVVGILMAAIMLLYIVKKRFEKGRKPGSWLFKNNPHNLEEFTILFQKPLDNQNKVVMMEFGNRQYLVIVGSTNLLLDTFSDKESIGEEGFENILKENRQELDNYMQLQRKQEQKNPLQSYKEKASLEVYRSQM